MYYAENPVKLFSILCTQTTRSDSLMPSLETVSFAVRNTLQYFNWTEAQLFATGELYYVHKDLRLFSGRM